MDRDRRANQTIFIKILIYLRNYFSAAILITLIYLQFSTRFSPCRTKDEENRVGGKEGEKHAVKNMRSWMRIKLNHKNTML